MMDHWTRCAPFLEPALPPGYTLDDVKHEIDNDRAQFWPLTRSAVVTQTLTYPQCKVLRIWLAGGDLNELRMALAVEGDAYARDRGCSHIEIDGRKGWSRVLDGFTEQRVVLMKAVN